jgi:aminopeptidase-like protein
MNELSRLIGELFPICRSITGNGVRQTLRILQQQIPLEIHEIPSGSQVFDWAVPKEWNINDAFIKNSRGRKIVDFARCNLHVVGYSVPFRGKLGLDELKKHLFTIPDRPDWIPYRTSYYNETWGFCLAHRQLLGLTEGKYEVCIDSSLEDGFLSYGEYVIPGSSTNEILISCHICHPSLCNDNLSGVALVTALAKRMQAKPRRYTYRFLFIPGTIGSITWLALNEALVPSIQHGFVAAGVGDSGPFTYKKSRRGDAEIDLVFDYVLKSGNDASKIVEFSPYGYDERQFCSPGFNLPVGCVMRTPHGTYPEYHTSADNLAFLNLDALNDSIEKCANVLEILERNRTYMNQNPKCEPRLGKRHLYTSIGGATHGGVSEMAMLWVLNLSDGAHSLLDIAQKSGFDFDAIQATADVLDKHELLKECSY